MYLKNKNVNKQIANFLTTYSRRLKLSKKNVSGFVVDF